MSIARVTAAALQLEASGDVIVEERADPFTLATAIPKGDRLDWLVQKTVEIGVDRIVLLDAERSVVRWNAQRSAKHLTRLRRIADESTRQSRRVWRTEVSGPVPARDVLEQAAVAEPGGPPLDGTESLVAIGPEGGWSDTELGLASRLVGLGSNVLRIETAAVVAAARRVGT